MYLYKENNKNIIEIGEKIKDKRRLKETIDTGKLSNGKNIYKDPDIFDVELYKYLFDKIGFIRNNCYLRDCYYENKDNPFAKYSVDGISWKQLYNIYDGNIEEIVSKLEILRKPENNYHFVWPRHKGSINQKKYTIFNDRIDYTLFDIKCFFEGKSCKMLNIYNNPYTSSWFNYFKVNGKYNFNKFVDEMNLSMWCIKEKNIYEVIDLSNIDMVLKFNHEINKLDTKYIENVLQLIEECKQKQKRVL